MAKTSSQNPGRQPRYEEEVVAGVLTAPFRPSNTEIWQELGTEEATIVKHGLVRAHEIRKQTTDPGQAYLMGMAAALIIASRQRALQDYREESYETDDISALAPEQLPAPETSPPQEI